jgi:hypothetical protein
VPGPSVARSSFSRRGSLHSALRAPVGMTRWTGAENGSDAMRSILLSAIFFCAAIAVADPAKPQLTLSVSPNKTLPGLSVPLSLRLRNGARAIEVSPNVKVHLISPSGESFFANWGVESFDTPHDIGELELGVTDEEDVRFVLPAKASVSLEVPAHDFTQSSWALDRRMLALPGEWALQVYLFYDDGGATEPIAISNRVKLTIEMPSGRDVPVWEAVRRGEFWGISQVLLQENQQSQYFPYLSTTIARQGIFEKISIISKAMELHPNSPVIPMLRYSVATYYGKAAGRAYFKQDDFDKAVELANKGRALLAEMKNGKDAWSRLTGNRMLGEFPSREYFVELRRLKAEKGIKKP